MRIWHECFSGLVTFWEQPDSDQAFTCPICHTSYIYTTEGWKSLDENGSE